MAGRSALIFHGTGGSPDVCWYRWLAGRLTARGYAVEVPHHPGLNFEPIATFLPKVLDAHSFDEETVLVGHSGGAALLLAILQHIDVTVAQAILVAGYCTPPNIEQEPVLQPEYDWAAIRSHVRDIYFINSRIDPYGCDDRQGRAMFERLGGTQIVRNDGHFGDHDQPYERFELVDRLIA
ncbi:alpha/beta fold hydrolase [Solwaraspora sp. WMMD792]|uniref:RBBP9/YdeN family alpha/beta hydrolase n=1 Tax=Solwaraspora sp. WMMD792 TaxID=3016099 RepID=UPI002415FD37|nr:alpha/beta fold hydrolase [Solwaraspora sp. WMMD792]MDG4773373.1 alpha/beta fold hydrolase [Solwaraspora sp. WMMD792]